MELFTEEEIAASPVKESSYKPTKQIRREAWEEYQFSPKEYAELVDENTDSRISVYEVDDTHVSFRVEEEHYIHVGNPKHFGETVLKTLQGKRKRIEEIQYYYFFLSETIGEEEIDRIYSGSYWQSS